MWSTIARRAGVLAVTVLVAGCADEGLDPDDTGAIGPDAEVSDDLAVLQVQIAYPLDGRYEEGDEAPLFLGIANDGPTADRLVDVRGEDFSDARLTVDGQPGAIPVPAEDNVYVGAEGAPSILLEDLHRPLRSSQSVSVTLVFQRAGEVEIEAMVAAERTDPTAPYDFPDPAEDPTT